MKISLILSSILLSTNIFSSQINQIEDEDGDIIECTGKYALCVETDCLRNPNNSTTALCDCPVYVGKNWGTNSCKDRLPANSNQVYSEYSPLFLLTASGTTTAAKKIFDPSSFCNASSDTTGQYVNCLNVLCNLTSKKNATCLCPLIQTQGSNTGYYMETSNCKDASKICETFSSSNSNIVVNNTHVALSSKVTNVALASYGQQASVDIFCSSQKTAVASAVADDLKNIKDAEKTLLITHSDAQIVNDSEMKKTFETFVADNKDSNIDANPANEALRVSNPHFK